MNALAALFDKVLLSDGRIGSPALYAFYTSLFSSFALVILPFGFVSLFPPAVFLGLFSGFLFLLGLIAFYEAVKRSEVSRAAPLIGVAIVVFVFLVSSVLSLCSGTGVDPMGVVALLLLSIGSLLLAKPSKGRRDPRFVRFVLLAGALMAASLIVLKETYLVSNFATGFVWSRMGMFFTGLGFLLVPALRDDILKRSEDHARPTKRNLATASIFVSNKIFGGLGAILISYAVALGPVTFVQGLNGTQFGFLLLLAIPLSSRFPHLFGEETGKRDIAAKVLAIAFLAVGVFIVAIGGNLKGFL